MRVEFLIFGLSLFLHEKPLIRVYFRNFTGGLLAYLRFPISCFLVPLCPCCMQNSKFEIRNSDLKSYAFLGWLISAFLSGI